LYFDATFKDARARRPIVDVARRHGVPVDAVVMATPLDEAIRRNDTRTPDRRVPDDVMARMYADLTGGGMPTRDEGFDRITVGRPGA
jgi:predicted kinase